MSTQEMLIEEIKHLPEPVLREVWLYLKLLERKREEQGWTGVLPLHEVAQESYGHPGAQMTPRQGEV